MLNSFVERIGSMPVREISSWLLDGLVSCSQGSLPAVAFQHARASFGQSSRDWRAPDEIKALFVLLKPEAQRRFHEAIGHSLEVLEATPAHLPVLQDMAEIGLLTRCNDAVEILAGKLRIPDPEVRSVIYALAGFYLAERDAPKAVRALALQILRNGDFPDTICLQLLVALARFSTKSLREFAATLESPLQRLLSSRGSWPRGYLRFQQHFADAVLRSPAAESLLPVLLSSALYASLLLPSLEVVSPGMVKSKAEPVSPQVFRIPASGLSAQARRQIYPPSSTSISQSLAALELEAA